MTTEPKDGSTCDCCGRVLPSRGVVCECGNLLRPRVYCEKCRQGHARNYSKCPTCGELVRRTKGYTARAVRVFELLYQQLGTAERPMPRMPVPVVPFPRGVLYAATAVLLGTGLIPAFCVADIVEDPSSWEDNLWVLAVYGVILLVTIAVAGWHLRPWRRRRKHRDDLLTRAETELQESANLPEPERKQAAGKIAAALMAEFGSKSGPT